MTGIAVLGSTGSIGLQTLEVIRAAPDRYELKALAAGHAGSDFEAQVRELRRGIGLGSRADVSAIWSQAGGRRADSRSWRLPTGWISWSWQPPA